MIPLSQTRLLADSVIFPRLFTKPHSRPGWLGSAIASRRQLPKISPKDLTFVEGMGADLYFRLLYDEMNWSYAAGAEAGNRLSNSMHKRNTWFPVLVLRYPALGPSSKSVSTSE